VVSAVSLGKALRQIRLEVFKGVRLDEIGHLAGFDKSNLSKLERGRAGFSRKSLGRLADVLGTPVSQIYALAEEIENGTATPDTVHLVLTIEHLPPKPRSALHELIDTIAQSTAEPDEEKRPKPDRRHRPDTRHRIHHQHP
jgi:transcriptional regulator with XRE-family HTH domain